MKSVGHILLTFIAVVAALFAYDAYRERVPDVDERNEMLILSSALEDSSKALEDSSKALEDNTKASEDSTKALDVSTTALMASTHALQENTVALKKNAVVLWANAPVPNENSIALKEGVNVARTAKIAVAEYYMSGGKFLDIDTTGQTNANALVGLYAPEKYQGIGLVSLSVGNKGVITLRFNKKSGVEDGVVSFIPDFSSLAMGVRWRCVSHDYPNIAEVNSQCTYAAKPKAAN